MEKEKRRVKMKLNSMLWLDNWDFAGFKLLPKNEMELHKTTVLRCWNRHAQTAAHTSWTDARQAIIQPQIPAGGLSPVSHSAAQELEGASTPSLQRPVVWSSGPRVCFAAYMEVWMIRLKGKKGPRFVYNLLCAVTAFWERKQKSFALVNRSESPSV